MKIASAAFGAVLLLAAGGAQGHGGEIPEARQALMKGLGEDLRAVKRFTEGRGAKEGALAAVERIAARAARTPAVFEDREEQARYPESKAMPGIWEDWPAFEKLAEKLAWAAERMRTAIVREPGGEEPARAFRALSEEGCGGCHRRFREEH